MKNKISTNKFIIENTKKMFKKIFSGDKENFKSEFANLLTMSRGILAPILIIISILIDSLTMSFIVILVSALTDCFDGWYARHNGYVSEFGALLDTISDKIFIFCIILPVIKTNLNKFIIILLLELIISTINAYFHFKGKTTKSSILGKIKTIVLDSTLVLCYLSFLININQIAINTLLVITIILQLVACINYITILSKK